jgi:hypothetical protein
MAQGSVQLVIGKLLTDADFRLRFEAHGRECLVALRELGVDLNDFETAALVETDRRVWSRMATLIDRRLQRGRGVTSERPHPRLHRHLTERQQRVLSGVCEGLSNKEIAAESSGRVGRLHPSSPTAGPGRVPSNDVCTNRRRGRLSRHRALTRCQPGPEGCDR